jgi:hypothetical protein
VLLTNVNIPQPHPRTGAHYGRNRAVSGIRANRGVRSSRVIGRRGVLHAGGLAARGGQGAGGAGRSTSARAAGLGPEPQDLRQKADAERRIFIQFPAPGPWSPGPLKNVIIDVSRSKRSPTHPARAGTRAMQDEAAAT